MRTLLIAMTIAVIAPYAQAAVEDDLRDGDKYFDDGDWKRSAAAYDRAIASAPGQVAPEAYAQRARIFIILKDYKGGLSFIQSAKRQHPNAPEVLEQEALMLWETDRRDDAVKVAEVVVKARPQSFASQKLIGDFYAQRDSVKTAAAFEAYLQYRPGDLEGGDVLPRIRLGFAYLANARSVLGDGDEARAKQMFSKAKDQFEVVQRKLGKKPNAMVNSDNGLCAAYVGLGSWDQAISVCERVIQDPKRIDSVGSVWYNLATAYLARKQTKKARSAGNEFTRVRKNEARGFMLLGDTFFEDREWGNALDQYLRAEKALKPNQTREQVQLSIKLGKTYRRMPAPAGANNPYLANAIQKLSDAQSANPGSVELAVELGGAYLEARQDGKAGALSDRMLASTDISRATPEQRAALLVVSGRSLFNTKKLKEARDRFEEARQLRPSDIQISRRLVIVINEQAFAETKNYQGAEALLNEALKIDKDSPTTLQNLAVLSIERGNCQAAVSQLTSLDGKRGRDAVATQRLLGRSYLCLNKPDTKKANEAFAAAEREAKKVNAQLALAEIYTEWTPLFWDSDLQGAVEKLELAYQVSSQDPDIQQAAQRNLALALYRRGWKLLKEGKGTEAASDFDRATRNPNVLKGNEQLAFEFSLALAQLDAGRSADAQKLFKTLAAKGKEETYLKGAYAKVGPQFFAAYASYRSAQSAGARQQACEQLSALEGQLGGNARDIVSACWESVAYDHFRAGNAGAAKTAITNAEKSANADQKKRLANDRTVANGLGKGNANELEALAGNPAESLVNLGIVYDMMNKPREAYDAWVRAKAKGVNARDLQKWIDAKKRIYGF
jgi:lipopolysaccharide biosynthesis regulator YciM